MTRKPPSSALGNATQRLLARSRAQTLAPRVRVMLREGMTLGQVAETLARAGIKTERGGKWRADSVRRILDLASNRQEPEPAPDQPEPAPYTEPTNRRSFGRII